MLTIEGLVSGYGESRVLAGLDLALAEGEVVALLGRNGMGKTTLLRSVMGLLRAQAGRVSFKGREITRRRPYEIAKLGIAYVPQGREIFPGFSVEENLLMGLLGKPALGSAPPARIFEHFPILAERRHQTAATLSGGQQQQLAIARALVGRPELLLLDEPSEGIQPSIVEEITDILARIAAEEGLTILLVEQDVEMALALAGRCAFMENGRIVAEHAAAAVREDEGILHRYLAV
jgi:branched-chain amino acid transport system ATP-binding protein/urea transport system ATP-binding protein